MCIRLGSIVRGVTVSRWVNVYWAGSFGGGGVDVVAIFVMCRCVCGGVLEYIIRIFNSGGLL